MRRWLTQSFPVPRWLFLAIILLSAAAFVLLYAQTQSLFNEATDLWMRLRMCRSGEEINYLLTPFWGALAYLALVQAGLACTLLVILAAAWSLRRRHHPSSAGPDRPAA